MRDMAYHRDPVLHIQKLRLGKLVVIYSIILCFLVGVAKLDDRPGGAYVYRNTKPSDLGIIPQWDENGYVFFCLCMGRTGNQMEHFLGGMAFAKAINRTLVVPPLRTYRNVRFTEWFKFEPLTEYHRMVLAEDFMEFLAPTHWPVGERVGFCYQPSNSEKKECNMKQGSPFGPFWDGFGIEFDREEVSHLSYGENDGQKWNEVYPASKFPVIAMRGAPAPFPMRAHHRELQRYLQFSERIVEESLNYINGHFPNQTFVGIHLRNGPDWINSCAHAEGRHSYMASPQCQESSFRTITPNMCYPSTAEIIRLTKNIVLQTRAKVLFVATDKNPILQELTSALENQKVTVYHADPHLPIIDLAILIKADHFIGNCISSFTSFVKRARDVKGKPTSFWGVS